MDLIQRIQDVMLRPKETLPQIEAEPTDIAAIYKYYLIFLAAIPALASFIGLSLIGASFLGISYRVPLVTGLTMMVVRYVMSLVMAYVVALIIDALAPNFGGTKNTLNAFKLVAFSMTSALLGGIFGIIPSLGMLGLLTGIYSIYLLYLGLPVLMKCPQEKAAAYTAVIIVCGIVLGIAAGLIMRVTGLGGGMDMGAMRGGVSTSGRTNADLDKTLALANAMRDAAVLNASKQVQQAIQAPTTAPVMPQVQAPAPKLGDSPVFTQDSLKALLPDTLADMKRSSISVMTGENGFSVGVAGYEAGARKLQIGLQDGSSTKPFAAVGSQDTDKSAFKSYFDGKRAVMENYQKDGSESKYSALLPNGVMVTAVGVGVDMATTKQAVAALGLDKIEAMPPMAKP